MSVKKSSSVGRTAGLMTVLLVACAVLSVATINLVVIPFLNSANQPKVMTGSVPKIAQATATVDFDEGPPPPGTPTGELPTPLPTLSKDELRKAPTAENIPGVPTLEPIPDIDAVAPTLAPVMSVAPSDDWTTYVDPNLKFSFQYPSNWYIASPDNLSADYVDSKGTSVTIESYNVEGDTKGGVPKDALKIQLYVVPEFEKYETIDAWFSEYEKREQSAAKDDATASLSSVKFFESNHQRRVQWKQEGAGEPEGGIYVALGKGKWLYFFAAYPATSKYQLVLDKVIGSLVIQ